MGVIIVLAVILVIVLIAMIFTRGKGWNLTFTSPVLKSGPTPMNEEGSPEEVVTKIEEEAERLGIHLSDKDVEQLTGQIRAAEDEAKRTGEGERSIAFGDASSTRIDVNYHEIRSGPSTTVPSPPPPPSPTRTDRGSSAYVTVVSAPSTPAATGGSVPVTFDIEEPTGATRQVTVPMHVPPDRWAWLAKGMRLPARIDPTDASKIEIDWDRL